MNNNAMRAPPITPIASEPMNIRRNVPIAFPKSDGVIAPRPSRVKAVVEPIDTTVLNNTMATASFNTDSPKMRALSFGSAPVDVNIARVATGSTALTSAANAQDSIGVRSPWLPPSVKYNIGAMTLKATIVPKKA